MTKKFIGRVTVIVLTILAIRLVASYFPDTRLWGFNQAGFIDYMVVLYPVLIAGALIVYYRRDSVWATVDSTTNESESQGRGLLAYGLVAIAGLIFYLFRVKSYFLGDGLIIIANPGISISYRELGEVLLHRYFFDLFGTATSNSVLATYRAISTTAGLLFSIGLIFFARKIMVNRFNFWIFVLLILTSANTVLFYGYVENYSMTTAVIGISILAAVASLRNKNKSLIPIAGFFMAVFFHTISLVYLPAFLIYAGIVFGGAKLRKLIIRKSYTLLSAMIILFFVGYAVARTWAPLFWRMAFLPFLGDQYTTDDYFLISLNHLLDYANLLFFLIPVTVVVLVLKLTSGRWSLLDRSRPEYLFLGVAAAIGLMSAFILEPKQGMARDWDLMSVMLIGASIFGIYFWIDRYKGQKYFKPATIVLVILSVSIFVPWIVLHNDIDGLRVYSTSVMKLDPKHSRPGLLTMCEYLRNHGEPAKEQSLSRYCRDKFPEIQYDKDGGVFLNRGQYSLAEAKFKMALTENPSWGGLRSDLGVCQLEVGKYAEALENLRLADALNPYNAQTYYYLGEAHIRNGDTSTGLKYLLKCVKNDSTILGAYISLGIFHLSSNQPDSTIYYLSLAPDAQAAPEIYYWKGVAALKLNDIAVANKNFDAYLKVGTDSSIINRINSMRKPGSD